MTLKSIRSRVLGREYSRLLSLERGTSILYSFVVWGFGSPVSLDLLDFYGRCATESLNGKAHIFPTKDDIKDTVSFAFSIQKFGMELMGFEVEYSLCTLELSGIKNIEIRDCNLKR